MSKGDSLVICVLDDNPAKLAATSGVLTSAGWRIHPFTDPDTFLSYARIHSPDVAVLDFGGRRAGGLQIRARLREVSPATWTVIALKAHHNPARELLLGKELVDLIKQYVAATKQRSFSKRSASTNREVEIGRCA